MEVKWNLKGNKKRSSFLWILLGLVFVLTSCGSRAYTGWGDSYYGWYEITEASGAYAEWQGMRRDSGILIADTTLSFYDADHFDTPVFTLKTALQKKKETVQSGMWEASPITETTIVCSSDSVIQIPHGMWMEGSLTTEEGSLTIRGFFYDWKYRKTIEADLAKAKGKLKMDAEELLPTYVEELTTYGATTSLEPAYYFPGLEKPLENVFAAYEADAYPAALQNQILLLDTQEDMQQMVLVSQNHVRRLWFVEGETVCYEQNHYHGQNVLVIQGNFRAKSYELRYTDYHKHTMVYEIKEDGLHFKGEGQ